jgi:hypothetical protein
VNTLLRGFFRAVPPEQLDSVRMDEIVAQFQTEFGQMAPSNQAAFAAWIVSRRDQLIDDVALMTMRGLKTSTDVLQQAILAQVGVQYQSDELKRASWEISYVERICSQLARGETLLLLNILPDLVDADLPDDQRQACYDMFRRAANMINATAEVVGVLGSPRQQEDMRTFRNKRDIFLENFPKGPPQPGIIETLANHLGGSASTIQELREFIADTIDSLGTILSLSHFLDSKSDDEAVNATNALNGPQTLVPLSAYCVQVSTYEPNARWQGGGP